MVSKFNKFETIELESSGLLSHCSFFWNMKDSTELTFPPFPSDPGRSLIRQRRNIGRALRRSLY